MEQKPQPKALRITSNQWLTALILMVFCKFSAIAQENEPDWWFDVEVLIFKYDDAVETVTEQFSESVDINLARGNSVLFTNYLQPDLRWIYLSLPECQTAYELTALCRPKTLPLEKTVPPRLALTDLLEVPVTFDGYLKTYPKFAHFLPESERRLSTLYNNIRWDKSTTPLFHSVWRQPVAVGEDNAQPIRIMAGKNLTHGLTKKELTEVTEMHSAESDVPPSIADLIEDNLNSYSTVFYPDQIDQSTELHFTDAQFELDGLFNVFIRYINGVPYLHIDAHMAFYTFANKELRPHEFKQRRRVISKQVHYFDHPYFGMIVELRRFRRPPPPTTE